MSALPELRHIAPLPKPAHRCPACRSTDVRRAVRAGLERLLLTRRPYECGACGRRFLDRPTHR